MKDSPDIKQEVGLQQPKLRKQRFIIYGLYDEGIEGWTDGTLWNGWATPSFEYAEALKIVDMQNRLPAFDPGDAGKAWYDAENDRFCFVQAGSGGEVEYFEGTKLVVDGEPRKLYPIGSWSWTWEIHLQPSAV
jgi:hypothetical protein